MASREVYNRHGCVVARIKVFADGYAVMQMEFTVPAPDVVGLVQKYIDDQKRTRSQIARKGPQPSDAQFV